MIGLQITEQGKITKVNKMEMCESVDNSKVKYLYDTKDAEGKAVPNAFDVANQVTYAQANGQ